MNSDELNKLVIGVHISYALFCTKLDTDNG